MTHLIQFSPIQVVKILWKSKLQKKTWLLELCSKHLINLRNVTKTLLVYLNWIHLPKLTLSSQRLLMNREILSMNTKTWLNTVNRLVYWILPLLILRFPSILTNHCTIITNLHLRLKTTQLCFKGCPNRKEVKIFYFKLLIAWSLWTKIARQFTCAN